MVFLCQPIKAVSSNLRATKLILGVDMSGHEHHSGGCRKGRITACVSLGEVNNRAVKPFRYFLYNAVGNLFRRSY